MTPSSSQTSGSGVVHDSQAVQRRRFPRQRVEAAVAVCGVASSAAARMWRGHALNLSEGGAGIIVAGPWVPGQVVRMEIAFSANRSPVQLIARVAHRNRLYCGLEFLGHGEQSRSELRQLLAS